jgi:hypothetical protein
MEISDLMAQFMQNHDRILPRNDRKDDQALKYKLIFDKSWEILDQAVGDLTRHNLSLYIICVKILPYRSRSCCLVATLRST